MIFKCNADEAGEAMRHRYERFEALSCHLRKGIQDGIKAHNIHEAGYGFPPAAPEEISMSLVDAVAAHLHYDEAAIMRFIENLRQCREPEFLEQL